MDRIDAVPHIKSAFAAQIAAECDGSVLVDDVVAHFAACASVQVVGEKVRRCCRNARAGQTIARRDGAAYTVPTTNERAACALLDTLLRRRAFSPALEEKVRRMRQKMRGHPV
jgi:hypothetical protein